MNVSCPACKTRYSVDDSRVPPTGVTIKCPKCSHTFVAKRPDAPPRAGSAVALPGTVAPPQTRAPPTPRGGSAVALPGRVAEPAPAPRHSNIPSATTDAGLDDLDLGLDDHLDDALESSPSMDALPAAPRPAASALGDSGMLNFIDDTADRARLKPSGPTQVEYKIRRRNGRIEGPYGVGRISSMLRNKELQGSEDISLDGVAWRAITSDPALNAVLIELMAEEDALNFGNVDLGGGPARASSDMDLALDDSLPPPAAPGRGGYSSNRDGAHHPSVGPAPGAGRSASSIEDIMGDLDGELNAGAFDDPGGPNGPAGLPRQDSLRVPGEDALEVGDIPDLPPFWQTYKKPITIFSAVMVLVLVGVFTQLFTPYGAFGIPALIHLASQDAPPPPPSKPPPPPPRVADLKEIAGLINEHCYECFRSVFATIAAAGPNLPDNMLALAKARGFATLAYGKEAFPQEDLLGAVEALNTVDLAKALGGNAAAANTEILKARSALEILSGSAAAAEPQLTAMLEQRPDDRELALLLGLARREMGQPVLALEALDKALVTEPTYAPALHVIGEIVLKQGGEDAKADAAQWFEKALQSTPSHARSGVAAAKLYQELAWAGQRRRVLRRTASALDRGLPPSQRAGLLHQTALAFDEVGKIAEVSDIAAEAARLEPANASYVATAAVAASAKGSSLEALKLLDPVLQRNPNDVDALVARARVYLETDDVAKGFLDLEAARTAAPKDHRVALWEARFNVRLGKLNDARPALARAIRLAKTQAEPNVDLGRVDLSLGDVDSAYDNAEQAVAKAPNSAMAHTLLGDTLVRRGQLEQAKETYARALVADDEMIPAQLGYANALRDMAGKTRHPSESKDLAEAIPLYLAALRAEPRNPQVLFEYGRALELQGDLSAALALYLDASKHDEDDPRPHLKMVAAYLDQDNLAEAKKSLERGRTIEMASGVKSAEVRFWEARVALADHRVHDAVASMRIAVDLEPRNALYHYWVGRVLEKNNSLYEAITYYEKAIQLNSRLAIAHRALGWTAVERHQFDVARASFDRYREFAPDDKSIWIDIGESYTRHNEDDKAAKAFANAIKFLPKSGSALVQMGNIMSRKGKTKEAIEYFRRATRAEPGLSIAWCQLGISTAAEGVTAAVRSALGKCVDDKNAPDDMRSTAEEILSR